jgi:hypothetical protein
MRHLVRTERDGKTIPGQPASGRTLRVVVDLQPRSNLHETTANAIVSQIFARAAEQAAQAINAETGDILLSYFYPQWCTRFELQDD